MTKIGTIYSLFYATSEQQTSTKELFLDTYGVIKDKHYKKDIERSVLLASKESYELIRNNDIDVAEGMLGENLLMDYNPYHLGKGRRLKIANVILEISQHCTLCKSFSKIDTKLPNLLKDDRGIFAKVVAQGSISVGDTIYLLDES